MDHLGPRRAVSARQGARKEPRRLTRREIAIDESMMNCRSNADESMMNWT
jgi:hypothetical protein